MYIQPNWPVPTHINAFSTLRYGGISPPPYESFNFGEQVGDKIENLSKNRFLLKNSLQLPSEPIWLKQVHSNVVVPAIVENMNKEADASFTDQSNQICVITTADCLPILLCNRQGTQVAAVHGGWKGLASCIIEKSLKTARFIAKDVLAWLGPAISQDYYEVGEEVYQRFVDIDKTFAAAFKPSPNNRYNRWLANLGKLARIQLQQCGVETIYQGDYCTYRDSMNFFSYRRDGAITGRMATLIWISEPVQNLLGDFKQALS